MTTDAAPRTGPGDGPGPGRGSGMGSGQNMGVGPSMAVGGAVVAVFVGGFGVWAATAPLESAAIAPGVVGVSGERKTVQHLEGGIVADILVADGEIVAAGQPLIVLDDTQARAALALLEAQDLSAAALTARLAAERDGRRAIRWPAALREAAAGGGEAAAILATQERIFQARAVSLANQQAILERRIEQLREESAGLAGEMAAQDRRLALLAEEIDGVRELVARGLEPKPRLLEMERTEAEIAGARVRNRSQIARVEQTIGETELQIAELGNGRLAEVAAELREVETSRSDLRERLAAARDVVVRTRVNAPVAGTVLDLRVFTRGGVITAGQPLMDIVPAGDRLVIEARVAPTDIEVVTVGLQAQVRLTAFSQLGAPRLDGRVTRVSADRLGDPRTGAAWYEARIALDPGQPGLDALELVPGMPAEVMIVTGARTPLDYLLKPVVDSVGRALREQ